MNMRRGRPTTGQSDAKARLVDSAQALFSAQGYEGTTLRAIAQRARCDPALIAYHFGSKRGLFAHVMTLAISPTTVLERALPGPPDLIGVRLIAEVLQAWDQPEVATSIGRLVQSAMTDEEVMRAFREYLDKELMSRLVEYLGGPDATARASAILTVVIGAIFGRYVIRVPTLAQQNLEQYWQALQPVARSASEVRRGPRSARPDQRNR